MTQNQSAREAVEVLLSDLTKARDKRSEGDPVRAEFDAHIATVEALRLSSGGQAHSGCASIPTEGADVEVLALRGALADLVSWFTQPMVDGRVWIIPAGERGADAAIKAARTLLPEDQR